MNFSELLVNKKLERKQKILQALENATGWKKTQLEGRLAEFYKRNYPTVFWDSSEKRTYIAPQEISGKIKHNVLEENFEYIDDNNVSYRVYRLAKHYILRKYVPIENSDSCNLVEVSYGKHNIFKYIDTNHLKRKINNEVQNG
jgi:hypothetical protein